MLEYVLISTDGESAELFLNDISQGVQTSNFQWDITLTEGSNNITVRALDSLSNPLTTSIFITLDTQPPDIIFDSPTVILTNIASQTVAVTTDGVSAELFTNGTSQGSQTTTFSWNIQLLEGLNNLTVLAVDEAGNQANKSLFVELDTIGPSVQITSPTESMTNNSTQKVNVSTDGTSAELIFNDVPQGMQTTTFSWTVSLIEGSNNLTIISIDSLYNPTITTKLIVLDTIGPSFEILSPTAKITNKESQIVEITTPLDLVSAELFVNGSSQGTKTTGFTWVVVLTDGANNLTVIAYDQLNNPSSEIKFVTLDKTIPNLAFVAPTDTLTNITQQTVKIDTNAASAVLIKNDISQGTQTTGFSWLVTLEEGTNNLTVVAYAASGSFAIDTYFITLDSTKPSLSISGVTDGETYSDTILIEISTIDSTSGIAKVELWVDTFLLVNQTNPPFSYSLDTTKRFDGAYIIRIVAVDHAGNRNTEIINIWINNSSDQTEPTVTVNGITDGGTFSGTITISFIVSDVSGINKVELYVDNVLVAVDYDPPFEFTLNTSEYSSPLTQGFRLQGLKDIDQTSHSIKTITYDGVGNTNSQIFSVYFQAAASTTTTHPITTTTTSTDGGELIILLLILLIILTFGGVVLGSGYFFYMRKSGQKVSLRQFILRDFQKNVCSICKRNIIGDQLKAECPSCQNAFHETHFAEAIKVTGKCPICKSKVTTVDRNGFVTWLQENDKE